MNYHEAKYWRSIMYMQLKQMSSDIESLKKTVDSLIANLEGKNDLDTEENLRNPLYFKVSGHLTEAGILEVERLYNEGYSIEDVAERMQISIRGASNRRRLWKQKKL